MVSAFIGIGSNLGDRQGNAQAAVANLARHLQIQIVKQSKWHETKAVCLPSEAQPDFINGVVQIETTLGPEDLFQTLKGIEVKMGRKPNPQKWQPRLIDLDLLFYGEQIVETPTLTIPHPHVQERRFVLEPLAEIARDFVHPILKKPVAELFQNMLHEVSASL